MNIEFDFSDFWEYFNIRNILIFLVGVLILIFLLAKLARMIKKVFRRSDLHGLDRRDIKKKWQEIEGLLNQKSETSAKLAVLEADKLLDHILKFMGFGGSSLGERLRVASYKFDKLRAVWWAHKIRNQIVHEANYRLDDRLARKAAGVFKKAMEELGVL